MPLAPATHGSMATGLLMDIAINGSLAAGTTHLMKALTGITRITTTIAKAGNCTKATGITKTMIATITMRITGTGVSIPDIKDNDQDKYRQQGLWIVSPESLLCGRSHC